MKGVNLISDFCTMVKSEEQRASLLQVVEAHRKEVKNFTKYNLKKC